MADLFSLIKDLTQNKKSYKDLTEDDIKQYNSFMVNRFLSMNKDFIELVNLVQTIPYEKKLSYYKIYFELLPKKSLWLQYVKSKNKEPNKDLVKQLSKYWECSFKETKENIKMLEKPQIKEILIDLGVEDKEITKLLK